MRTQHATARKAGKGVLNGALSLVVALGLVPVSAFGIAADDGRDAVAFASEEVQVESCVIAKVDDAAQIEGEPIVSSVDGTYLLGYASPEEAAQAAERLSEVCEFAEVDARIVAAGEDAPEGAEGLASYAEGADPFTKAAAYIAGKDDADGDAAGTAAEAPSAGADGDTVDAGGPEAAGEGDGAEREDGDGQPVAGEGLPDAEAADDGAGQAAERDASDGAASREAAEGAAADDGDGRARASADSDGRASAAGAENSGAPDADGTAASGGSEKVVSPVLVALVDSGAPDREEVVEGLSMIGDDPSDENGHATKMLDIICDQAPDAEVLAIRVLDAAGAGTVAATYAGIKAAIAEGADIINLSLYAALDDESAAINSVVREAREAGIVVVAAAGNEGKDASGFVPANAEGVITAGSCSAEGVRLASSNYGDAVDLYVASDATSVAAAATCGWLAGHSDLRDPLGDLDEAYGDGTFYKYVLEPAGAGDEEDAGQGATDGRGPADGSDVLAAMGISQPAKTELRSTANRSGSAVPAQTIVIDNHGELPLKNVVMSGNVPGLTRGTYLVTTSKTVDRPTFGVWIDNPGTQAEQGYEKAISGNFTLKWVDVASDAEGNRLDLTMEVSDIRIRTNDPLARISPRILLFSNTKVGSGTGFLKLSSRMEAVNSESSRIGVSMMVKAYFHRTGKPLNAQPDGTYLMVITDLDQPDGSIKYPRDEDYAGTYAESMQLVSGFNTQTYVQKTIPGPKSEANPDPGPSLLTYNTSTGKFTGTEVNDDDYQYRAGFVAPTTGAAFVFRWWGSGCDTILLNDYEGVTIRDKNDSTDSTTNKAIISKTTNACGQKIADEDSAFDADANHGGRRTSTSWRSTAMPWKGSATYHFRAKPGYRVVKVSVLYDVYNSTTGGYDARTDTFEGSNLNNLTELTFGDDGRYKSVRDYDIVVTTAKVDDASAVIEATKLLKGRDLRAKEFNFELWEGRKKVGEASNAADGSVKFPALSYTYSDQNEYPLTHTYTIKEVAGDLRNVTYDDTEFEAKVVETFKKGTNTLSTSVSYAKTPKFNNVFSKSGGVKVKKLDADTGKVLAGAEFAIYEGDRRSGSTVNVAGLTPVKTITSAAGGVATTDDKALSAENKVYTIVESKAPNGYERNDQWFAVFTLAQDGQIVDLTAKPCEDAPMKDVSLPRTGAAGVGSLVGLSCAAVAAGLALRRKLRVS